MKIYILVEVDDNTPGETNYAAAFYSTSISTVTKERSRLYKDQEPNNNTHTTYPIVDIDFPMPNLAFWVNECRDILDREERPRGDRRRASPSTRAEALELLADLSFALDGYIKSTMQDKENTQ